MFTNNNINLPITIGVVAALSIPAFHTLRKLPSEKALSSTPASHFTIEDIVDPS